MAQQVVSDVGADAILKCYFNNTRPSGGNNFTLKLYCNNYTPVQTSIASNFTEATGGGYVAKTLTNGSFTINTANDPSDATYATQTWTFTGALTTNPTIYGWYLVDGDGVLITAGLLDAANTPTANGDTLAIPWLIQASSGTPA